ncbi:Rieske 2Fe-2S domain-containing protein [Roseiarcaceae bacterium H3SJ34-1]|uniref:Rieske 2Fe-2S domain-containing protein n=1 Tax=Terripilifer ovatus TaxID=3032367 RepID=UPI003AB97920|nr:Rieske 2Fe-2S domain-containing protein [Roseiarcaceae bacterium H3SJ34-1]
MLSVEDNERLTRVGPGTPMGDLLRELWTPAVRSASLEAEGAPKQFRLLGEDLVVFRDADGKVGVMQRQCPHRCASLALARNEGDGLRCIFHGWKFGVDGKVLDVPTEPADHREAFAQRVPVTTYPAREAGGLVWVYMGKRATPPSFYDFEFHFPPADALVRCAIVHGNWLQGFEGQLDSAHLNFLHSTSVPRARPNNIGVMLASDAAPRFEFIDKPYGFREAALRSMPDGSVYARIREVVLPYYSLIPGNHGEPRLVVVVVPIDDEWSAHWYYYMNPFGPVPQWYLDQAMDRSGADHDDFAADRGDVTNAWHQDRKAMKGGHFSGIMKNFVYEDFIIEESMGPIMDRSREFLGTSDTVIVRTRRMLLKALDDHAEGKLPFGIDQEIDYRAIRALAVRFPGETDWRALDTRNPSEFGFHLTDAAE